jgi:hypothetical protein
MGPQDPKDVTRAQLARNRARGLDGRGAPSGMHCTERQQRHQGTLAAVEVDGDRPYTGSIDESARGNICTGSVEGPNPRPTSLLPKKER